MISGASEQELELAKVVNSSWCISKEQLDYFVGLEKENTKLKTMIRKISWKKYDKKVFEGSSKQYLVVYKNGHDLLNEFELQELLLHPKKDRDIQFIFNWEDRLIINTTFDELKDSDVN